MGNPTLTARQRPANTSHLLQDGYRSVVTFASDPDIRLWEKSVTPPGIENGEPIDTTTAFNYYYNTKAPQRLIEVTEFSFKAAYSPYTYSQIVLIMGCPTSITVWFPERSRIGFFGYLRSFVPDELTRGTQPEATVTVVPTMWDYLLCSEGAFVVYEPTGSCNVWGGCYVTADPATPGAGWIWEEAP